MTIKVHGELIMLQISSVTSG